MNKQRYPRNAGDGLIFREDFLSIESISANGVITGTPFVSKGLARFSNSNYITYNDTAMFSRLSAITMVMKIPVYSSAAYRVLLSFTAAGSVFQVGLSDTNTLYWYDSTSGSTFSSALTIKESVVVMSHNGTTLSYYQNGVAVGGGNCIIGIPAATKKMYIGTGAGVSSFDNYIKSIRIYKKAFTAAEVLDDYLTSGRKV